MYKHIAAALVIAALVMGCHPPKEVARVDDDSTHQSEPADNSYCYVCHINYKSEALTLAHEKIGVGCEACHGMSDAHSSDENGLTAPERMFATDKIVAYCTDCHNPAELRKIEMHLLFVFVGSSQNRKVCTDCHGKHRLENRTRKWNKDTGVLVWKDGSPIMDQAEGL
jgi:hypothetical protein